MPGADFCAGTFLGMGAAIEQRADGGGQRNGQNDAGGAGQAADQLQGEVGGTHQLMEGQLQGVQVDDQHQAAAQKGQNQRVGHGAHHVPADVHARLPELAEAELGIDRFQLPQRRGDGHGHIHHRAQGGDDDPGHQQPLDLDGGFAGLAQYGFDGDNTPIIRGSALKALEGDPKYVAAIDELMDAVDTWIDTPVRDTEKPFLMSIEDVFTITGRGTVVTGRVERVILKLNDEVEIVGLKDTRKTVVTGIEMFRKSLDFAEAGDNAGVLLRGINREDVERGQVLAKPGSVTPHKKFKAEVYVLSKEEGGRHTPFFSNYRPQFYFRTTDVTGVIELPAGVEMVMPGDNVSMTVELINKIAIENGTEFSIREGGRTVGAGKVTEIIE